MAAEHEPGCDRQHTARQRCNQNALFAEQGEVTPNDDAAVATPEPAAKPVRTRRRATPAPQSPAPALSERPAEEAERPVETETVDEIVSIREEIVAQEHLDDPSYAAPEREPWTQTEPAVPGALIVALAVFGIVTAILVVMLLRGGNEDPATNAD